MRVLSLGAGVQSTTLLRMSIRGELPKLDAAIFADTGWEPKAVYAHLEILKAEAAAVDIPIYVVSAGDLRADAIEFRANRASSDGKRFASMPMFIKNNDGSQGTVRRQCTKEYKIEPIHRKLRELLGYEPGARIPIDSVEQWKGISLDEIQRAKPSPEKWTRQAFPLLDLVLYHPGTFTAVKTKGGKSKRIWDVLPIEFDGPHLRMTRQWCLDWHFRNGLPEPPKSACIGCPYTDDARWSERRANEPAEFADAVEFDRLIRESESENQSKRGVLVGMPYIHRQMVPLSEVRFVRSEEQPNLFINECEGHCGV